MNMPTALDGMFAVNQLVNAIFTADIVMQFFMPVPTKHEGLASRVESVAAVETKVDALVAAIEQLAPQARPGHGGGRGAAATPPPRTPPSVPQLGEAPRPGVRPIEGLPAPVRLPASPERPVVVYDLGNLDA